MPYIFGKLWHLAIILAIRKSFHCILQGVRFLLANYTLLFGTSETFSYTIAHSHHNFQSSLLGGQSNEAKIASVVLHSKLVNDGWNKAINHLQNIICFWLSNVWVSLISDFFTDPSTIKIIIAEFLWNWKLQFHFVVTLKTNLRLSLSKQAYE